jgi:hypothetical protein
MTQHPVPSVFGILSWMKEQQPIEFQSLDAAAARFGLNRDQMRRNMQWLQRHECVKRGGVGNAEWSITQLGLVRLAEGRFSKQGAFLSPYEHASGPQQSTVSPARESSVASVSDSSSRTTLDSWTDSTVPAWARPREDSENH